MSLLLDDHHFKFPLRAIEGFTGLLNGHGSSSPLRSPRDLLATNGFTGFLMVTASSSSV